MTRRFAATLSIVTALTWTLAASPAGAAPEGTLTVAVATFGNPIGPSSSPPQCR